MGVGVRMPPGEVVGLTGLGSARLKGLLLVMVFGGVRMIVGVTVVVGVAMVVGMAVVVSMVVAVRMPMAVLMRMTVKQFPAGGSGVDQSQTDCGDEKPGKATEPGDNLLRHHILKGEETGQTQQENTCGMGHGNDDAEKNRLPDRSSRPHQISRHHGLPVSGRQSVDCSQNESEPQSPGYHLRCEFTRDERHQLILGVVSSFPVMIMMVGRWSGPEDDRDFVSRYISLD